MAFTVDPLTFVIKIPKADLTLIQSSPTEIRELNINNFRLDLKDWEDSADGMGFLKTHTHNTEVTLSGVTYSRVVEILDPYTITFEDGQYAVNLVAANSNIGDKVNVNQVSVRSNNSAGLISSPDIEFSSFNGGVTIDTVNGVIGTIFPRGTERLKSNNISDAKLIADFRGFKKFYFQSDITLDTSADISDFILQGQSSVMTTVIVNTAADVANCIFRDCNVSGVLDGNNSLEDCVVGNISYINGKISRCSLEGNLTLQGNVDSCFTDCYQGDFDTVPEIDMGTAGYDLIMTDYSGKIKIVGAQESNSISIGLDSGEIILDSATVTNCTVNASGSGILVDENGDYIQSGTWNGSVTVNNDLVNKDNVQQGLATKGDVWAR